MFLTNKQREELANKQKAHRSDNMSADDFQALVQNRKSTAKKKTKRPLPQPVQLGQGTKDGITELVFHGRVPGNNDKDGLLRMHHRSKTELRNRYQLIVTAHRPKPHTGPVRLELIRHSIGRAMDNDNLVSTGKLLIDAIVRAGVLPDDNEVVIVERSYTQTKALNKNSQMTVIRIIDLAPPEEGK